MSVTGCSMRIYPHLQDTGGFFVAVLQKKKSETPTTTASQAGEKKKRTKSVISIDFANLLLIIFPI